MSQNPRSFRACIMGASLDVGNMGVRALGSSVVGLIRRCRPDATIYFLYGNSTRGTRRLTVAGEPVEIQVVNYRMSPKARLRDHILWNLFLAILYRLIPFAAVRRQIARATPWLNCISSADFVGDIRGGDSFSDIYGLRRFLVLSLPCLTAIFLRRPLVLLPQTYGPFHSLVARSVARFIMRHSSRILSRDRAGIRTVRSLLGNAAEGKSVEFCPDVAFSLESMLPPHADIVPPLPEKDTTPLVGLNVSGLLYTRDDSAVRTFGLETDYRQVVQSLLTALMAKTDAHVLLVPHVFATTPEDDAHACATLWESVEPQFRDRVHLLTHRLDQNHLKGIIRTCNFFIGARMHSCIAALSQRIPAVGIAYSQKFRGVFDSVGLASAVLDARTMRGDDLVDACIEHYRNRGELAATLVQHINSAQSKLEACFRELLSPANAALERPTRARNQAVRQTIRAPKGVASS